MLPIRSISYLSPMRCNFWEKCINRHKIGQGCSTLLKSKNFAITFLVIEATNTNAPTLLVGRHAFHATSKSILFGIYGTGKVTLVSILLVGSGIGLSLITLCTTLKTHIQLYLSQKSHRNKHYIHWLYWICK